jgi:myosin-crossreactive antigen
LRDGRRETIAVNDGDFVFPQNGSMTDVSIVLASKPHFPNQPADVQVFWGYSLFPDRVGDFVPKPMAECNGAEILRELCAHLRFDPEPRERRSRPHRPLSHRIHTRTQPLIERLRQSAGFE